MNSMSRQTLLSLDGIRSNSGMEVHLEEIGLTCSAKDWRLATLTLCLTDGSTLKITRENTHRFKFQDIMSQHCE